MAIMELHLSPRPDDDTAAAVLAAVAWLIEQKQADQTRDVSDRTAWQAAAVLAAQGLPPARSGAYASWHTADRAGRAGRWSYGMIGI
jgi:hypothetical protein